MDGSDNGKQNDGAAAGHLRVMAIAYNEVERARAIHNANVDAAKDSKRALDDAISHALAAIRDATRGRPLPLLDSLTFDDGGPAPDGKTAAAE